jgi:hypothetical protein
VSHKSVLWWSMIFLRKPVSTFRDHALAAAFATSLIPAFLVAAPAVAQQPEATIIALDSLKWNPIAFPGITIAVYPRGWRA